MSSTGRSPAFQFYPRDFLADANVMGMSLEEVGAYWKLCCVYWNEDGLPADPKRLARILGVQKRKFDRLWPAIAPCFRDGGDGELRHDLLDQERRKQDQWREKSAEGGARSARMREARKKGTHTDAEWQLLLSLVGEKCPRCKKPASMWIKNHVLSAHQGGSDSIDNIQPLCGRCNSAKGSETIDYVAKFRPVFRQQLARSGLSVVQPPLEPKSNTASATASASASADERKTDTLSSESGADAPRSFPHQRNGTTKEPSAGALMGLCRKRLYVQGRPPKGRSESQDMNTVTALLDRGIPASEIASAIEAAAEMRDDGQCKFADTSDSLSMGALVFKPQQEEGWTKMPFWTEAMEYRHQKYGTKTAASKAMATIGDVLNDARKSRSP